MNLNFPAEPVVDAYAVDVFSVDAYAAASAVLQLRQLLLFLENQRLQGYLAVPENPGCQLR